MTWSSVLVGYGRIAAGYAQDRRMKAVFRYPTHASVLRDHPDFDLVAVVDHDPTARETARHDGVPVVVDHTASLPDGIASDVAILAMPPSGRREILDGLPGLKAVVVEKPLGAGADEAEAFAALCRERGLIAQVNLLRRGDLALRRLAEGELHRRIGDIQSVFGVYGRGLFNTATHMIDLLRMVCGDVVWARAVDEPRRAPDAVLAGDLAVPFVLGLEGGAVALFSSLDYRHYREAALDVWGTAGRYSITQESLTHLHFPRAENRGLDGEREIASDRPEIGGSGIGEALYHLYDNLADSLRSGTPVWSSIESALRTERIIHAIVASGRVGGEQVRVD